VAIIFCAPSIAIRRSRSRGGTFSYVDLATPRPAG
jgi:hypothetical protein